MAGSKAAEIRAGIVVLIGLVILGLGLFFVSGGWSYFEPKNKLTVHFPDAGTIGTGASVFLAGRRVGEVAKLEPVPFTHEGQRGQWIAVTIEISKGAEVPVDSTFQISKSITNLVAFNITPGKSRELARENTPHLIGERLATTDEAVHKYTKLAERVGTAVDTAETLMKDIDAKVKQVDIESVQGEAHQLLQDARRLVAKLESAVDDNRGHIDGAMKNLDDITLTVKNDLPVIKEKFQKVLDQARVVAEELTKILQDNSEGIRSIVRNVDDFTARLSPTLTQIQSIAREVDDAVVELRPGLRRVLASAERSMENAKDLTEDLKTSPWKLVRIPSNEESDDVHLYNAARSYVDAAGRVQTAIDDLDALRKFDVLQDASRVDLVERALATLQEALADFDANQKRFANLIESRAK